MAKIKLSEEVIPLPDGEILLREGMMLTMSLFGNKSRFPFKYVLTDRGIWTRNRKSIFVKQKNVFLPYNEIASYKASRYGRNMTYIFYQRDTSKKTANRIFFDDPEAVAEILDQFIAKQ